LVSWAIDDGNSDLISAGYGTERAALDAAQRHANQRGESVYVYDDDDPHKDYIEVESTSVSVPCAQCGASVLIKGTLHQQYPGIRVLCSGCAMHADLIV
jgi:hypothetical protein